MPTPFRAESLRDPGMPDQPASAADMQQQASSALATISGEVVGSDRAFFLEVYCEALNTARNLSNGDTLVHLFDIDGTITRESDTEASDNMTPRSFLPAAISTIAEAVETMGINYQLGVLTDHSQAELDGPDFPTTYNLPPDLLIPALCISSRDNPEYIQIIDDWRTVNRDETLVNIHEDPKIAVLDKLAQNNLTQQFLLTDDRASTRGVFSPNVHGQILSTQANGWPVE